MPSSEIEDDCPHCSPSHGNPDVTSWGVYVHPDRDGDGQPVRLIVCKSDGAHVAESDAEWLREILREHDARRAALLASVLAIGDTRPYCVDGTCGRTAHGPHVPHPLVPLADENHWNDVECDQRPHCMVPAHHSIDGGEADDIATAPNGSDGEPC